MRYMTLLAACVSLLIPAAVASSLTYNPQYDNANQSLTTVACSNGANGLMTRGYTTFGSLPSFPYIGGATAVTGWNSAACGTCYNLTYAATGTTITVLAIDAATYGFNIAETAMNTLTRGNAIEYGNVTVAATEVPASVCGL